MLPWLSYYLLGLVFVITLIVSQQERLVGMGLGCMVGLIMQLGILGSLLGRHWLSGLWLAVILAALGFAAIQFVEVYRFSGLEDTLAQLRSTVWSFFSVPFFVFSIASPFLLLRAVRGWQLEQVGSQPRTKQPISLSDLIWLITCLASLLFMTRVTQIVFQLPTLSFWLSLLPFVALIGSLSLLASGPALWCLFHIKRKSLRWVLAALLIAIPASISITILSLIEGGLGSKWWYQVIGFSIASAIAFPIGIEVLKFSGYRLTRYQKSPSAVTQSETAATITPQSSNNPFLTDRESVATDNPSNTKATQLNSLFRSPQLRWSMATLLLAIASSFVAVAYEHKQSQRSTEVDTKVSKLLLIGGDYVLDKYGEPIEIELSPSSSLDSIGEYASFSKLRRLSLSQVRVSDEVMAQLPKWFPELTHLDLAYTQITAEGLAHISKLRKLRSLGLAGTTLSIQQINTAIPQELRSAIERIDLSETKFSPTDPNKLDSRFTQLAIRNMNFDDKQIAELTSNRNWEELDISGNPINGSGLRTANLSRLIAHSVPLQDANFPMILRSFEFSNTQFSDTAAKLLSGLSNLVIGPGDITNSGLNRSISPSNGNIIFGIAVHDPLLDCAFVSNLSQVWHIDLSGSGVTDETLSKIATSCQGWNRPISLSLANTKISDQGLQSLDGIWISSLDLRGTSVTAHAIAKIRLRNCDSILVEAGQFNAAEIKMLKGVHKIVVGGRLAHWENY